MDATPGHPWEQQPGESAPAFAAFRAYRDLGPDRNVPAAYRQSTGKGEAKQAGGNWNAWAKAHRWPERARAFDAHFESIRLHAADEVAAERARTWAARREEHAERLWRVAQEFTRQAERLAKLPCLERATRRDGSVTVKAANIRELKAGLEVAVMASDLAWSAIEAAEAMFGPDPDFDPVEATTEELRAYMARTAEGRRDLARHDARWHRERAARRG